MTLALFSITLDVFLDLFNWSVHRFVPREAREPRADGTKEELEIRGTEGRW
jgi:hypothetical protein